MLEESGIEGEFDKDEAEVRIELLHNPIGTWEGVVGLQINDTDFQTGAPEAGEEEVEEHHDVEEEGHGHGDFLCPR